MPEKTHTGTDRKFANCRGNKMILFTVLFLERHKSSLIVSEFINNQKKKKDLTSVYKLLNKYIYIYTTVLYLLHL